MNRLKIAIPLIKIKSSDDKFFSCEKKFIEIANSISDWILDLWISNESKSENESLLYNLHMYITLLVVYGINLQHLRFCHFFFAILCPNLEKGGGGGVSRRKCFCIFSTHFKYMNILVSSSNSNSCLSICFLQWYELLLMIFRAVFHWQSISMKTYLCYIDCVDPAHARG